MSRFQPNITKMNFLVMWILAKTFATHGLFVQDIANILLGSLPSKGTLYHEGRAVISLIPATNTSAVWASEVLEFSSEYPGEPAVGILGPQEVFTYGDDPRAWSTLGNNFTCIGEQFCYTEFITVKFPAKLYISEMVIVEVFCSVAPTQL